MPEKMVIHDDRFYILDDNKIFIFSDDGKYVGKINKQGRGRGECSEAYDFNINKFTGDTEILSPSGVINLYDRDTLEFKRKIELQTTLAAFHAFDYLGEDIYVLLSQYREGNQILLYSISEDRVIGETYEAPAWLPLAGLSYPTSPFYYFDNSLCFIQAYDGEVFNIESQQPHITTRYQWDFGNAAIDIDKISSDREYTFYIDYFKRKNNIATHFVKCLENSYLFITCFTYKSAWYQLIYDKQTNEHRLFPQYQEGISMIPLILDDNYAYVSASHRYIAENCIDEKMLDKENLAIFKSISENDNPVIIKCKFRR